MVPSVIQPLEAFPLTTNGKLDRKNWEASASTFCKHLWITDCELTANALNTVKHDRVVDTPLGIEFEARITGVDKLSASLRMGVMTELRG